jgi:hypothetical protein
LEEARWQQPLLSIDCQLGRPPQGNLAAKNGYSKSEKGSGFFTLNGDISLLPWSNRMPFHQAMHNRKAETSGSDFVSGQYDWP